MLIEVKLRDDEGNGYLLNTDYIVLILEYKGKTLLSIADVKESYTTEVSIERLKQIMGYNMHDIPR